MRRLLLFLLLIVCLPVVGCDDNVDIGLVAEQIQSLTEQSAIQTTLPDEVLAAMRLQAERMDETVKRHLEIDPDNAGFPANATAEDIQRMKADILNRKQKYIEKGIHEMDFHALQKAFYTQYIDAGGIAIVANEKVEDVFLYAARDAILIMTSKHPKIRDRLLSKHGKFYMVLIAEKDDFYDMPELQLNSLIVNDEYIWFTGSLRLSSGDSDTQTGFGYAIVRHGSACPPINVFIHEFAHVLEWEIEYHQPGFRDRVVETFEAADKLPNDSSDTLYRNAPHEYWAEGVELWFRNLHFTQQLIEKHPVLSELIAEWFPKVDCIEDSEWIQPDLGDGWVGPTEVIYHSITWEIIEDE